MFQKDFFNYFESERVESGGCQVQKLLSFNGNSVYIKKLPEENDKELNGQRLFYEPMIFHNA